MVIYHDMLCWNDWGVALLFCQSGFWMDFFRIKEQRRGVVPSRPGIDRDLGGPPNLMFGWNEYLFEFHSDHKYPLNLAVNLW